MGAAILVGGQAKRFGGRPKGLIEVEGRILIHRLINALPYDHKAPFLVGDPEGPYKALNYQIHADIIAKKGAPGGVLTALTHSRYQWIYILACDLPYLNAESLMSLRPKHGYQVVLPVSDGQVQFLAGLWSRDALDPLMAMVESGNPSLGHIIDNLDVHFVPTENKEAYFNLNTYEDWEKIDRRSPANLMQEMPQSEDPGRLK